MKHRVAVMVDGDAVDPVHARLILQKSEAFGAIALVRVYGSHAGLATWQNTEGFFPTDASPDTTAARALICIDAMEFALTDVFDTIVIASTNNIFAPLARRLKQYGMTVVGIGDEPVPPALRNACTTYHILG